MTIVQLNKLYLYGTTAQQESVLEQLQQLGCVHLVPLRELDELLMERGSQEAKEAYRYLLRAPMRRRLATDESKFDRESLISELLEIKNRRAELWTERDELTHAIEKLTPWGEFRLPSQTELPGYRFYFYQVPLRDQQRIPDRPVSKVVSRDNRFAYVVVVAASKPETFVGESIELDPRPQSELRARLDQVEEELEELHWRRTTLTRWRHMLRDDLNAADDQAAKVVAAGGLQSDEQVFALQGWMPEVARQDVEQMARDNNLALVISKPGADESPPTLLKNPERVAGAEKCVTFYITPGYHTWDPTTVVFFSFSLFFAMIIADAGYGLVMAAVLALGWSKIGQLKSGPRIRNLFLGIITATIIYGVMVGSFFGVEPNPGSLLDSLRVRVDGKPLMENRNLMMAITVAIGVAHLSLANFITAFRKRRQLRSIGHLGWGLLMIGAFLLGAGQFLEVPPVKQAGIGLAATGGVFILLFSSDRPLWTLNFKTHAMRLVDGLVQVTNLSKAFGDVLSYLRLFALGLASAQLAITFNGIAAGVYEQGGIGILFAIVILLVGHGINFLLGLMGGVVHGLRLNCIEFFNWGLTQEGYAFVPFNKRANR